MRASWDDRIRRAGELHEQHPFAREALSFYREVLLFQEHLADSLSSRIEGYPSDLRPPGPPPETGAEGPSLDKETAWQQHGPLLLSFFPPFLSLIRRIGTRELASGAARLLGLPGEGEWERLLQRYWAGDPDARDLPEDPALAFFPKAFLQPYAELLAAKLDARPSRSRPSWNVRQGGRASCPVCGRPPQLGILAGEGEGAGRSLLCSLCATDWRYKRICCPACGEENFSRLSYSRASDFPHLRVDLCSSCDRYMKAVDLTVDGRAIPPVDEIASLPLDLWAVEQGYVKIELNLVGL